MAQTDVAANGLATEATATGVPRQVVRFARADDQGPLAWSSAGAASNPPLIKTANWLSHLELDWEAPIWSPLFHDLTRTFRFIRYDGRGCGLSAREVPQVSFETMVSDLERVVDAAGLERFPLLGVSEGACIAIEYAARHPERVSHLILFGSFAAGWRHIATPEERREHEALMVLTEAGWERDNPCYRGLFSRSFMPDANSEELSWFDEFQRHTTSPTNAVRLLDAVSRIDYSSASAKINLALAEPPKFTCMPEGGVGPNQTSTEPSALACQSPDRAADCIGSRLEASSRVR